MQSQNKKNRIALDLDRGQKEGKPDSVLLLDNNHGIGRMITITKMAFNRNKPKKLVLIDALDVHCL